MYINVLADKISAERLRFAENTISNLNANMLPPEFLTNMIKMIYHQTF